MRRERERYRENYCELGVENLPFLYSVLVPQKVSLVFLVSKDTDFWHKWALKCRPLHLALRRSNTDCFTAGGTLPLALDQSVCVSVQWGAGVVHFDREFTRIFLSFTFYFQTNSNLYVSSKGISLAKDPIHILLRPQNGSPILINL